MVVWHSGTGWASDRVWATSRASATARRSTKRDEALRKMDWKRKKPNGMLHTLAQNLAKTVLVREFTAINVSKLAERLRGGRGPR